VCVVGVVDAIEQGPTTAFTCTPLWPSRIHDVTGSARVTKHIHRASNVDRREQIQESGSGERRDDYCQLASEPHLNRREKRVVPRKTDGYEPPRLVSARDHPRHNRKHNNPEIKPESELEQRPEHHCEIRAEQRGSLGRTLTEKQVPGADPEPLDISRSESPIREKATTGQEYLNSEEARCREISPPPQLP